MTFWTQNRVNRVLGTAAIATVVGILLSLVGPDADRGALQRGDFPPFYAAAVITATGQSEHLYSAQLQARIENHYFPSLDGRYLAFVYPPFVASWLRPLAAFSPSHAKLLYTAAMVLAYFLALRLFSPFLPEVKTRPWKTAALSVLFAPLLTGLLGGQNSALSLLFYALIALSASVSTRPPAVIAAIGGISIGLWLMKPHFAIIAAVAAAPGLGTVTFVSFAIVAALSWIAGAMLIGPNWIAVWWDAIRSFTTADSIVNGHQMVSLVGAAEASSRRAFDPLSSASTALIAGAYILSAAAVLYFAYCYLMLRRGTRSDSRKRSARSERSVREKELLLALGPLIVLASPHTLFYDLTLCIPALGYLCRPRYDLQYSLYALGLIALFCCCLIRSFLPVQPMAVIAPLLYYVLVIHRRRRSD